MNVPVFDLHCDTAFALLGHDYCQRYSLYQNNCHIDLQRASSFPRYAQCFACFTCAEDSLTVPIRPEQLFQLEYDNLLLELEKNSEYIRLAQNAQQIQANAADGYASAILTLEGTAGFGYNSDMLDELYEKGFRITTLGWNEENCLAGSHVTGGGLTRQGRVYVQKAQHLGMLVDVSHISDAAFWDIIDITEKPVIATHSNSRAVHAVSRNLSDDMFLKICQTGGVTGINLYADFLGRCADLDTVCDHILHFIDLDPSGKHIALGGDLDGCDSLPAGFLGIQSYPELADHLVSRGVNTEMVLDIFWNNALGVIERCCI